MRCDLPDFKRCCLCVPLRHGVLIFGYLNLLFSLFNLSMELRVKFLYPNITHTLYEYRGVRLFTHMWLPCFMFTLDAVFNGILLVGAHRKNARIIRAYYYYGIMTTVAVLLTFIVTRHSNTMQTWYPDPFTICVAFAGFVLQCYLLLIIRSELMKLRYQGEQFRYVNHMAEVVVDPPPPGEGGNPL